MHAPEHSQPRKQSDQQSADYLVPQTHVHAPARTADGSNCCTVANTHALVQVIADAQRVGHDGERRIHGAARGKKLPSTT